MATDWTLDDEEEQPAGEKPAGGLRQHLKRLEAENKHFKEELAKRDLQLRKNTLTSVITEKGLDPRIAAFVPADVETTTEAITAWLTEYGDLFGSKTPAGPAGEPDDDGEDDELGAELGRMGRATAGARTPSPAADLIARINDPKITKEELEKLILSGGALG